MTKFEDPRATDLDLDGQSEPPRIVTRPEVDGVDVNELDRAREES